MRDRESGFTLLELMFVVAVISILAAIALPSFFSESRKAKARAEVQPIFNDLRVRLEQYLQEHGHYPATIGEGTMHPTNSPTATTNPINPLPAAWDAIKVRISGVDHVYCSYTWATGLANAGTNIGTIAAAAPFTFTAPETDWYYLLAKCNLDGNSSVYSYYFASSANPNLVPLNEGL
jgi:prepilin-type N-terminal cleavage/methylation domain-containing protein